MSSDSDSDDDVRRVRSKSPSRRVQYFYNHSAAQTHTQKAPISSFRMTSLIVICTLAGLLYYSDASLTYHIVHLLAPFVSEPEHLVYAFFAIVCLCGSLILLVEVIDQLRLVARGLLIVIIFGACCIVLALQAWYFAHRYIAPPAPTIDDAGNMGLFFDDVRSYLWQYATQYSVGYVKKYMKL